MNSKVIISIAVWLVSIPLLFFHLILFTGFLVNGYTLLPNTSLQTTGLFSGLALLVTLFLGLLSWVALFVMTKGWVKNNPVSRSWPIAGTICAIAGLIPVKMPILLAATPEIIFACLLPLPLAYQKREVEASEHLTWQSSWAAQKRAAPSFTLGIRST